MLVFLRKKLYRCLMYIYQLKNWPNFTWNKDHINNLLITLRHEQGFLIGAMESIGFPLKEASILKNLTSDIVKSSQIEGEILNPELVRSSIARHLGIEIAGLDKIDRNVEGIVEMVLDATQNFDQPLTKERLLNWHGSLFPEGRSGFNKINTAAWRKGAISVVSGKWGEEKTHFEGPPAEMVDKQMALFFDWINGETSIDPILMAAVAHLWFVTIHPFEDGNGRIGRAIADFLLARSENNAQRFYSLSAQIQKKRRSYYSILEKTQKDKLDITKWIEWFLACLGRAIEESRIAFHKVLEKAKIWEGINKIGVNERQKKVINLLLGDFKGKLTTSKWAKIAKCSQDTAYRDILDLVDKEILFKNPEGGRSTSYSIK